MSIVNKIINIAFFGLFKIRIIVHRLSPPRHIAELGARCRILHKMRLSGKMCKNIITIDEACMFFNKLIKINPFIIIREAKKVLKHASVYLKKVLTKDL